MSHFWKQETDNFMEVLKNQLKSISIANHTDPFVLKMKLNVFLPLIKFTSAQYLIQPFTRRVKAQIKNQNAKTNL